MKGKHVTSAGAAIGLGLLALVDLGAPAAALLVGAVLAGCLVLAWLLTDVGLQVDPTGELARDQMAEGSSSHTSSPR